jgi:raffinose/stachyose/melibiose transport system permease protein
MIYRFLFNNEFGLLNNLIRVFNGNFNVNWFFESPAAFWAITFTWLFYAVVITLVVLSDLMAISSDIHEAAIIDGASGFQIMTRIDLPLCRFSIGTSVIMGVTSRISMYEAISLTSRGGPGDDTMSLSLILVKQISDFNYGLANAAAMVMLILGAIIMLLCNRLFRMNEPV